MSYTANNYTSLIGMQGFSETLLRNHFALYQAYVNNTNTLMDNLDRMLKVSETAGPAFSELKRRLGWEFNGMRLHELYFGNLGETASIDRNSVLARRLSEDFGSFEAWEKDFKATAAMRGIGWAVLYQDTITGRLFNVWINEHDTGHPAGCNPVLVLDVFEHAFMTDYHTKKADYIQAFMKNISWSAAGRRLEQYLPVMKKAG